MKNKFITVADFFRWYSRYDLKREGLAWVKTLRYYLPTLLPAVIIIVSVLIYIEPFPDKQTYLAIGQEGSGTDRVGKEFSDYFKGRGLTLTIENTSGLDAGLQQLGSSESKINASFVTSGTATGKDFPNLVSLGSVQIAPLWLFYRGNTIATDDPFEYYLNKKIGVGAEGTVTNKIFVRLMEMNNPGTGNRPNFQKLTHIDAAKQLRDGKLDAIFIVNSYDSEIVQSLLNDPSIKLMNFPLADAYARKLPFLQKVVVPRASIDIDEIRPASDITLLASSINLLVQKDVHPAIQWAFLLASEDFYLTTDHFFNNGEYPNYKDKTFPLSPIANRFYTSGQPELFNYLPIWLAALLENMWFLILAFFLVILPFIYKVTGLRSFISQKFLWKHFWVLRYLEDELNEATSKASIEAIIVKLEYLETTVANTWVEDKDMRHYYNLNRCIASTLSDARKKLAK